MRNLLLIGIGIGVLAFAGSWFGQASVANEQAAPPALNLESLLSGELGGVEGYDVMVSRVTMPPNSELPRHWHPGDEIAYVLEGSTILRRDGKPDVTVSKGELVRIPLKEIHAAATSDEGAQLLVYRVHEQGQPVRVLAD